MTKKHFDALAAALRSTRAAMEHTWPSDYREGAVTSWTVAAEQVADVCARFNPKFNRARFLAACGVDK